MDCILMKYYSSDKGKQSDKELRNYIKNCKLELNGVYQTTCINSKEYLAYFKDFNVIDLGEESYIVYDNEKGLIKWCKKQLRYSCEDDFSKSIKKVLQNLQIRY